MIYSSAWQSPVGTLYIAENGRAVTHLSFRPVAYSDTENTPLIVQVCEKLKDYFAGRLTHFDLPLEPSGTAFQMAAWEALLNIPYGQTRTYKEQAEAIGNIRAVRAVGAANAKNPIAIIIPCHRVIGADKSLTGYGGGLEIKKALLDLESKNCGIQLR